MRGSARKWVKLSGAGVCSGRDHSGPPGTLQPTGSRVLWKPKQSISGRPATGRGRRAWYLQPSLVPVELAKKMWALGARAGSQGVFLYLDLSAHLRLCGHL